MAESTAHRSFGGFGDSRLVNSEGGRIARFLSRGSAKAILRKQSAQPSAGDEVEEIEKLRVIKRRMARTQTIAEGRMFSSLIEKQHKRGMHFLAEGEGPPDFADKAYECVKPLVSKVWRANFVAREALSVRKQDEAARWAEQHSAYFNARLSAEAARDNAQNAVNAVHAAALEAAAAAGMGGDAPAQGWRFNGSAKVAPFVEGYDGSHCGTAAGGATWHDPMTLAGEHTLKRTLSKKMFEHIEEQHDEMYGKKKCLHATLDMQWLLSLMTGALHWHDRFWEEMSVTVRQEIYERKSVRAKVWEHAAIQRRNRVKKRRKSYRAVFLEETRRVIAQDRGLRRLQKRVRARLARNKELAAKVGVHEPRLDDDASSDEEDEDAFDEGEGKTPPWEMNPTTSTFRGARNSVLGNRARCGGSGGSGAEGCTPKRRLSVDGDKAIAAALAAAEAEAEVVVTSAASASAVAKPTTPASFSRARDSVAITRSRLGGGAALRRDISSRLPREDSHRILAGSFIDVAVSSAVAHAVSNAKSGEQDGAGMRLPSRDEEESSDLL